MYSKSQKIIYNYEKKRKKNWFKVSFTLLFKGTDKLYQDCKKMNCYQFTLQINFSKDNLDA